MTKLIYSDKRSRRTDQYLISVTEAFKQGEINLLRKIYRDIELIDFPRYKYYLARCPVKRILSATYLTSRARKRLPELRT